MTHSISYGFVYDRDGQNEVIRSTLSESRVCEILAQELGLPLDRVSQAIESLKDEVKSRIRHS